jgi:hypothetical protein
MESTQSCFNDLESYARTAEAQGKPAFVKEHIHFINKPTAQISELPSESYYISRSKLLLLKFCLISTHVKLIGNFLIRREELRLEAFDSEAPKYFWSRSKVIPMATKKSSPTSSCKHGGLRSASVILP